jgi:hypothetical protein
MMSKTLVAKFGGAWSAVAAIQNVIPIVRQARHLAAGGGDRIGDERRDR